MLAVDIDNENAQYIEDDVGSVSVTFPGQDGIDDQADHEEDCPECFCAITCEGSDDDHDDDCPDKSWRPEPPQRPICYDANGAGVEVDEDRVRVWISFADPRGAFCLDLERRYSDPDEDGRQEKEFRLSVPDPTGGMPHYGLELLGSRGYYRLRSYGPWYEEQRAALMRPTCGTCGCDPRRKA